MYSDENKSSSLAKLLNGFDYAIIDTCSLMDDAFPEWMDVLHNAKEYRKKDQHIYVPRRCYDELKKHARQTGDDSKRIDALRGLKILKHDKWWTHLLTITKKDKTENFADNAIFVKVSSDRLFSKILIITQDKSLASDLRALNSLRSQNGKHLEVCKIIDGGKLVPNLGNSFIRERSGSSAVSAERPKPQHKDIILKEKVIDSDRRISSVLGTASYPEDKKRADVLTQLRLLESLSPSLRAQLVPSLMYPPTKLKEFLAKAEKKDEKTSKPQEKPEAKKTTSAPEKPAKQDQKPKQNPAEPAQKAESAPKAEPAKAEPKEVKDRLWYGAGKTFKEAILDCAAHYKIVFHEPSVLYYAPAHGPFDLTTGDLDEIEREGLAAIKADTKCAFSHKGIPMWSQKVNDSRYKCWIDVNATPAETPKASHALPAPKQEPVPLPAPQSALTENGEATKDAEPKPAKKSNAKKKASAEPAEAEKPAKAKETEKPAKAKAATAKKLAESKPSPKEKDTEAEKPKKASKTKKAAAEQGAPSVNEEPKKPAAKKKSSEPKNEEAPTSVPDEEKPKDAEKKAEKPAKTAAKSKKPAKTEQSASAEGAAEPAKKTVSPEVKKARTADRRLSSAIPNPTYPLEAKIADMTAQRALLETLDAAEVGTLRYSIADIDAWLSENAVSD